MFTIHRTQIDCLFEFFLDGGAANLIQIELVKLLDCAFAS
jgi:hypothetical protein